jgi:hypothetical protein
VPAERVLVAGELLIEDALIDGGEALATVLPGKADTGQLGVEEHPLDLPLPGHPGQLLLVVALVAQREGQAVGRDRLQVGADEGMGPQSEALEILVCFVHRASSVDATTSAKRWRCSAGVP